LRILGIDPGEKRIGVAVSDPLGITAQGVGVIQFNTKEEALDEIDRLCNQYEAGKIVVGLPLDMKGHRGRAALLAEELADGLQKKTGLPVFLQDERLSSRSAEKALIAGGLRRNKRKKARDMIAAVIILETYLQKEQP